MVDPRPPSDGLIGAHWRTILPMEETIMGIEGEVPIVEPVPIQDIFADSIARIEPLGLYVRLVFTVTERTNEAHTELVRRVVAKLVIPDALGRMIGQKVQANIASRRHAAKREDLPIDEGAKAPARSGQKSERQRAVENHDDAMGYYFEEGRLHFTERGLKLFTRDERNRLQDLFVQHAQKFDKICDHVSVTLGHGSDPKALSPALRDDIISEAQQAIEQWEEGVEISDDPNALHAPAASDASLQQLLTEQNAIAELILDIQDVALRRAMDDR
jgi:hypothetical protein